MHPARPRSVETTGRNAADANHFRPDIEGLRGLAILLVVAFHAAPAWLGGGFIGVDVFFVISGFLITGLLVRELERNGRISLGSFYARRVRRLLPAAVLAIGVTLLLSAWILPPLEATRVATDGLSAALSVSNVRFAIAAGDYFSAIDSPSPFLHYWSLSVEEQFYLVWPALLIVAFALSRSARSVAVAVAALAAISLVLAVLLTDSAANWAFFSLPTRAWQLALGGLLALAAVEGRRTRGLSGLLAIGGWVGLAAVLAAGFGLDGAMAYPGLLALVPTIGAVAIIAGGDRPGGPGLLLRLAPMRFLGRISYALYLWHWPLLVLPAAALGRDLAAQELLLFVGLAVLVATASTIIVEEPIRRGSTRASGRRQVAVVGALGLSLLVSVSIGLGTTSWITEAAIAESRTGGADASASRAERPPGSQRGSGSRRQAGAGPGDAEVEVGRDLADAEAASQRTKAPRQAARTPRPASEVERTPKPRPKPTPDRAPRKTPKPKPRQLKPKPKPARTVVRLPANVSPSVWDAPDDEEVLRDNHCLEGEDATRSRTCEYDPGRSRRTVALVGDSHASHWYPALRRVAKDRRWKLVTFVKVSCPFTDMRVMNLRLKREYRECSRFNENTIAELRRIKPDLVVTALSRWQHPKRPEDGTAFAQGAAIARILDRVPGRKVVLADVPYPGRDVPACLSKNLKDVRRCEVPAVNRSSGGSPARERIAAKRIGGAFIDFGNVICGGSGDCPVVSHDRIIFRDDHHMTATFSRWLAPAMDRALAKVLKKKRR